MPRIELTARDWLRFVAQLRRPAAPTDALKDLLARKAPWEQ